MQKVVYTRELSYHLAQGHSILVLHQIIEAEDLSEDTATICYVKLVRQ